jgi:hypothetical protein
MVPDDTTQGLTLDELLTSFADADEPMVTLTDEELYVLTAAVDPADRLVPLEVLDTLDEPARLQAARSAHRSLVARGIVAPVPDAPVDPATGLTEIEVRGPALIVLDLLGASWPFVLLTQQHGSRRATEVHCNLVDRAVLTHQAADGIHRFWLRSPQQACRLLATALDPGAAATSAPDEELVRAPASTPPPSWPALRDRIDAANAAVQLLAVRADGLQPSELTYELAGLDDGLVLLSGERPGPDGQATEIVVRRLSQTTLLGIAVHALGMADVVA